MRVIKALIVGEPVNQEIKIQKMFSSLHAVVSHNYPSYNKIC